jgi:hypothetical protein
LPFEQLISDTVHHEGEDAEKSVISEVLVILVNNSVKLNDKNACEARSSNLESWEPSPHLPEDREKPRKPTGV